ncbi:MAG: hypothetical protein H0T10_03070, partial [Actinobacteria bacterium]|nr:hypothetical protein [Actinomycetota bacterium]
VHRQISELRKTLGAALSIETRSPGYVLRLVPGQLDLRRFELLSEQAAHALLQANARLAADLLREALGLWRGPPLADLAGEPFAQVAIGRLEEIRLAALEQRLEADLALNRHSQLVGELEAIVAEHPLRERFAAQLMLALYRSGRQTDALGVYRRTRDTLVEGFGIEASHALQELQRAILTHDSSLDVDGDRGRLERDGAVLVIPSDGRRVDALLAIAEPLARGARELIVARLLRDEGALTEASSALDARRGLLDVETRTAAFTTVDPARDVVRLAETYDVKLVLLDAPAGLDSPDLPRDLAQILELSPADVGVLSGREIEWLPSARMFVPFGGAEHDWAALEVAAWLASATHAGLCLVGTGADRARGRRDASRLLADAALAVQRLVGVSCEPLLVEATEEALLAAVEQGALVVVGFSSRWRSEGLGATRRALVQQARPPALLVHRGLRPGGLAPREHGTRFTWTIEARPGR